MKLPADVHSAAVSPVQSIVVAVRYWHALLRYGEAETTLARIIGTTNLIINWTIFKVQKQKIYYIRNLLCDF